MKPKLDVVLKPRLDLILKKKAAPMPINPFKDSIAIKNNSNLA